jgi:hypothetical protein
MIALTQNKQLRKVTVYNALRADWHISNCNTFSVVFWEDMFTISILDIYRED